MLYVIKEKLLIFYFNIFLPFFFHLQTLLIIKPEAFGPLQIYSDLKKISTLCLEMIILAYSFGM